ncbi:MAG: bifunctional folylpolyglutamate synthase/dihydrofolate synthase [Candidatus Eremiobacteraeota bacterium]|nr:bifunctional folylpolyglutamate synthase/dihydrofolate synthase [Candidatus Eremiobacteraeota bacterium]
MRFEEAERYLLASIGESASPRTNYGLDRIEALLAALGDPHRRYPVVHVAGTSGKGSTATMIERILRERSLRVGLHVKPHLQSMTERARIDGVAIDRERFAALFSEMLPTIDRVADRYGAPSYYEMLLALAFLYFAREAVDIAAIEVGLGGRLDGTNVVAPTLCVITSIGYDHQEILGDTLEAIATEKAGIAKPGVPLVSAVREEPARSTIAAICARVGAPIVETAVEAEVDAIELEAFAQRFTVHTSQDTYTIRLPLLGGFQRANAVTAILAVERLPEALRPSRHEIEAGLAEVRIPGRMELVPGTPSILFDIAHNEQKARSLAEALRERFDDRALTFVVGIGESKDARAILGAFARPDAYFFLTSFEAGGRPARAPEHLGRLADDLGLAYALCSDPIATLARARTHAGASGIVVVTGSTFAVAALRPEVLGTPSSVTSRG